MLDHLDDLDADFRAFFRYPVAGDAPGIGDEVFGAMSSTRFFALAYRSTALSGVMAARVAAEQPEAREHGVVEVPSDPGVLAAHPAFAGRAEYVTVPKGG